MEHQIEIKTGRVKIEKPFYLPINNC